jgi:hypothetical protein
LGGASVLRASREKPMDLRTIAVLNSITMAAHQVEEYVDPGYFAGQVNVGMFKSDQPQNYPYNPKSASLANPSFTLLYAAPIVFPKTKWLGIPAATLSIGQVFAHWIVVPLRTKSKYSPGGANAILVQLPLAIAYFRSVRAEGPIQRSDLKKSAAVCAAFAVFGVALPNVVAADKNSPYAWDDRQLGPYAPSENADT